MQALGSLTGCKLFADVPREQLRALEARCRFRRVPRNERAVDYRDETTDVYFVLHGRVRVTIYSAGGREVIFRDFAAGDYFGELAAIDGGGRSAAVVAVVDSVLATMPAAVFWDAIREHATVAEAVLKRLAAGVRILTERVLEFSTLAVRNRIHAELLRLARSGGAAEGAVSLVPPPTHAEIASRVSTHREAVTREFSELARAGVIERRSDALLIRDIAELERMVRDISGE
jgi:CRP/FNR family cyclic AMP-dependent transcriptional regulator